MSDPVQSLWGSFQQGGEVETLARFAEIAGVFSTARHGSELGSFRR